MDVLTKSSVDNLLKRIMNLASRPIVEFNRFEAMELVEGLKNAAHDTHHEKEGYYNLVHETLRGKLELPNDQFRNYIFPLLGDKDHEKVLDVISKVRSRTDDSMGENLILKPVEIGEIARFLVQVSVAFTVISWATLERVVLREKEICVHCLIVVMVLLPMLESSALAFQFNTLIMLNEISVWLTSDVRNMK